MAKINKELLRIMDDYRLFLESEKKIECPVVVSKEKQNHRSSLYVEGPVSGDYHIDSVMYNCELRDKRIDNYSISLVTDSISEKMLFRLDQGNGTHRNNLSGIALEEQSVPAHDIPLKNMQNDNIIPNAKAVELDLAKFLRKWPMEK